MRGVYQIRGWRPLKHEEDNQQKWVVYPWLENKVLPKNNKGVLFMFFAANHFKRKSKDAAMGQKPDAKIEELN